MYLKKLTIKTPKEIIREMDFKAGLNLIIDDTDDVSSKTTGNNVGKTTVLKLSIRILKIKKIYTKK